MMPTKIVPPTWAFLYLVIGLALHFVWLFMRAPSLAMPPLGILILTVGFTIMFWAWKLFHRESTSVCPFEASTRFIQEGPYRFIRNPMYLGMTLILTGIAVFAGTPPIFIAPIGFFVTINKIFIPYEEKKMEETFGKDYLDYKRRVRRWL